MPRTPTPSAQSDLIVTGMVVGGRSFLTGDRRNIYSEAHFKPTKILKGARAAGLLTLQQDGGTVRLENGRIIRKLPAGGSYPLNANQNYLLFLRYQAKTEDYLIIGAWDISQSEAHLLSPDGHKITSPTGQKEQAILTETLLSSVANEVKERKPQGPASEE